MEWVFLGLICLIQVLCLRDYFSLMKKIYPETHWPKMLSVIFQVIGIYFLLVLAAEINWYDNSTSRGFFEFNKYVSFFLFLIPIAPVLFMVIGVLSKKISIQAIFQSVGGFLYIALPMLLLMIIRSQGLLLPLVLIVMIWSNDTMAYLVGSFFGKTPFSPISPKKTWEGTVGGAIITIIAAAIVWYYTHTFRVVDWVMLALCATIAGTLGDLLESKLKRMANVKDSGTLMPGHGGALDRFDSLLVATPFACVYVVLFM